MNMILALTYSYLGTFNLEVQIGNRTFIDILKIEQISESQNVSGTFEVPRVFLSSFSGTIFGKTLIGEFEAKEGGKRFLVQLKASFESPCRLRGELIQEGFSFGKFEGFKENCHESSH